VAKKFLSRNCALVMFARYAKFPETETEPELRGQSEEV